MSKVFFYSLCSVFIVMLLAEPFLDDQHTHVDRVVLSQFSFIQRKEHIQDNYYQTTPIQEVSQVIGTTSPPNFLPIYLASTPEGTQTSNSSLLPYGYKSLPYGYKFQAGALVASMGSVV
jgi:hypothetical protein